jgi:hypothetical protein
MSQATLNGVPGYGPFGDDLLAASVVHVEDATGAVLDELTLFPAVDVARRTLGDGTDTFLATEHIACLAGRFCGWRAVFFQVRSGRIERLRALGVDGAPRDVEATASFAARWTFRRGERPGAQEIVTQREDPLKSAWIEQRFFFRDGSWRVSEREAAVGDEKFAAEPGQWAGRLD